jgi:dTDP-L-rhamnose 4-epimerase
VQLGEGMAEFVAWAQGEDPIDRYEQTVTELRSHGLFGNART